MHKICRNILILTLCSLQVYAQKSTDSLPVYNSKNLKWELPISAAFLATSSIGFRALERHASMTEVQVAGLNPQNINAFDRHAAFLDPTRFSDYHKTSDMFLNIAVASPVLLLIDRNIRHDWKNFANLFLMTHAVNNAIYFATAFPVRRARPLTYNTGLPLAERSGEQKSNSFYSGHVSFSASSTFFMAKMYTDHHHIKGWKRLLFFTGAAIPPATVGYYRIKAGRHFKTDVITGLIVGAACGITIPELHRNKGKDNKLTMSPLYGRDFSGLSLTYHL